MPKKPNSHGNDQEYVPAGNGDASGEYADEKGSNWHFENFGSPKKTTSKIDIVKSDIYGKTNVYVDNKLILRDLSDEEADELRRAYEKEKALFKEDVDNNIRNDIITQKAKKVVSDTENKNRNQDHEIATIIDKDGIILGTFDGAENEVYINPQLLKATSVATHNHPKGTCFSKDDIQAFVDTELYQLRATAPNGKTYVLSRQNGFVKRNLVDDYKQVGAFGSPQQQEVQNKYIEYLNDGYAEYDAKLKAQSDIKEQWLLDNTINYNAIFTIEWED